MRATFRGALAALAAIALAGCTPTGSQAPTEAPAASASQALTRAIIQGDPMNQLLEATRAFEDKSCNVLLRRGEQNADADECRHLQAVMPTLADKLRSELRSKYVPAEMDAVATATDQALEGLAAAARTDAERIPASAALLRASVLDWAPFAAPSSNG